MGRSYLSNRVGISVVLTCYKEGEVLRRAYASLEAQTDQDFEIIIVNDASPDGLTNDICYEIENKGRAKLIWRKKNGGPAVAKDHGVEAMAGNICVPLDGDDVLPPGSIASIRKGFNRFPEAGFVFGDYIRRELASNTQKLIDCSVLCDRDRQLDPRRLAADWVLLGTSPCWKSVWQSVGGHSKLFSYDLHDMDFFMRLLVRGIEGFYLGETIYIWNRSSTGINSNLTFDAMFQLRLANLEFLDKFGDGVTARKECMYESVGQGNFASAQGMARQLLRRRCFSTKILGLAACPPFLSSQLYALSQRIRNRTK